MSLYFLFISHITSIPNAKALLPRRTGRFFQYTAENYYENRSANLIIIIRLAPQAFYREFLSELPIRSIL